MQLRQNNEHLFPTIGEGSFSMLEVRFGTSFRMGSRKVWRLEIRSGCLLCSVIEIFKRNPFKSCPLVVAFNQRPCFAWFTKERSHVQTS